MNNLEILGVKIDNLNLNEVLDKIDYFLKSNIGHYIVTTNPEFIVEADKNFKFKKILNEADLSIADGFGLILATWLKGQRIKKRLTGADLTIEICRLAEQNNCSVFLIGGISNTAQLAAKSLKRQFPRLNIVGAEQGLIVTNRESRIANRDTRYTLHDTQDRQNNLLIERINRAGPAILFVAFGHPKQEKWIKENLAKIPSIRLAMGVGGTFDYLAGKTPRAPHFMRNLGLEWLFRLIIEPWRVKRIYNAVFGFLWLVIKKEILSTKS